MQTLTAMYAYNAPTFLITNVQWKVFVENRERNQIFTFPFNDEPGDLPQFYRAGRYGFLDDQEDFLKAVAICILARPSRPVPVKKVLKVKKRTGDPIIGKEDTPFPQKKVDSTLPQGAAGSKRNLQGDFIGASSSSAQKDASETPIPCFLSHHDAEGNPVYTEIRVMPPDQVAILEERWMAQESEERLKAAAIEKMASDATLFHV